MKPYQNVRDLDPTKIQFDALLSKIRVIVKRALGVLKGIKKEMFAKRIGNEKVPGTIADCRILHNICIKNGRPDPDIDDSDDDSDDDLVCGEASANADAVRDLLNLSTKDPLLSSVDVNSLCFADKRSHLVHVAFVIFTSIKKL